MIKENKLIKNFKLPSTNKKDFCLKDELNTNLILYVYPKDNTPGCTTGRLSLLNTIKSLKF